jgi:uncharacterized protein
MIIENAFDVDADPDRVFDFLQNPHNVATCFPGAELTEDLGDDRYKGKVKIKLGPVTAAFSGIARITEKDDVARVAVLVAEGKDARGSGTAKATATMRVEPKEGGGSSVLLKTDLTISGRLAQFGRGIMADVSNRMVGDLSQRVRERIESESADAQEPAAATAAAEPSAAQESATGAPTEARDTAAPATETPATEAPVTETAAADAAPAEAGTSAGTTEGESPVPTAPAATPSTEPPAETASAGTPEETASAGTATTGPAAAPEKAPAAPAEEPANAIKASTMIKVVLSGMFRRLFARLRGRSGGA